MMYRGKLNVFVAFASMLLLGTSFAYSEKSEISYNTTDASLTGLSQTVAEKGDLLFSRQCVLWRFDDLYLPYCAIYYERYYGASVASALYRQSQEQAVQSAYVRDQKTQRRTSRLRVPMATIGACAQTTMRK